MSPQPRDFCPLFADIFGVKLLYEKLDNAEALQAVERCFNRMERAIAGFKGRVVKHSGDQLMAVFDSAESAMRAACEMQLRVENLPAVSGVKLAIGVGFHYGPAQEEDNDVYGNTVNIAARLVKLAKGGQIITSEPTIEALPAQSRLIAHAIDSPALKINHENLRIFAVIWQKPEDLTLAAPKPVPATAPPAQLRLLLRGQEILLGVGKAAATLGRDVQSDLVIKDPRASRHHSRIEQRRGIFVLVDLSTNGTYVSPDGEKGFLLKREEYILKGRGCLSFGQTQGKDIDDIVAYEVL